MWRAGLLLVCVGANSGEVEEMMAGVVFGKEEEEATEASKSRLLAAAESGLNLSCVGSDLVGDSKPTCQADARLLHGLRPLTG